MNLSVGENIKRLRNNKNLTQEEVSVQIGVTSQAISKWERGDGYPDIELLPVIANFFAVSVDELLGVSNNEKKSKYDTINESWSSNHKNGLHIENVVLMKEALKLFPNDALLLVQLSTSLEKLDGSPQEIESNLRESIAVQEHIIKYCDDCEVRGATLYNICFAYWKIGEKEKAIEQARKLPNLYKSRENALVYFTEDVEKKFIAKEALKPLAWGIAHHLSALAETENNTDYYRKAINIINTLFDNNDKDVFISSLCDNLNKHL